MSTLDAYALTARQREYGERAISFAQQVIAPRAAEFDEDQYIPRDLFRELAREGYTGANVDGVYGGSFVDNVCIGLLHQAVGAACTSVRSILTVHGMVCETLRRWGTASQRSAWLPRLASGETIGAFALTEPDAGSDARAIVATATRRNGGYVLSGQKCWITGGGIADVFLVMANSEDGAAAFLVTADTEGLTRAPLRNMLGQRGAMLTNLQFQGCELAADRRIGRGGFLWDAIVGSALDFGRYSVAWGCVGIGQACLDICLRHAAERRQFNRPLRDHQLVRAMLTEMLAGVRSAGLMCRHAGELRDQNEPRAIRETCLAKYVASRMCAEVASNAVQIHGALGCGAGHAAQRHYRDAKIMEIIEGSTQIQQDLIAGLAYDGID